MKKHVKVKMPKNSKSSAAPEPELPSLVTAMAKLVERLEGVERKVEQVFDRVSNLPTELWNMVQHVQRPNTPHQKQATPQHNPQPVQRPQQAPAHNHRNENSRRERPMFKAVCADCQKECEIPFKPTGERPVYCKACFAVRKSGRASQNGYNRSGVSQPQKNISSPMGGRMQGAAVSSGNISAVKTGKQKSSRNSGSKSKKRK